MTLYVEVIKYMRNIFFFSNKIFLNVLSEYTAEESYSLYFFFWQVP